MSGGDSGKWGGVGWGGWGGVTVVGGWGGGWEEEGRRGGGCVCRYVGRGGSAG